MEESGKRSTSGTKQFYMNLSSVVPSVARILLAWIQVIRKQIKSAVMLSDFEMMVLCREHDSHSLGQS